MDSTKRTQEGATPELRHVMYIAAWEGGRWGYDKPYAEIREQGVHHIRRVKTFKARSYGEIALDAVYDKACAWAASRGYSEVFHNERYSVWAKPLTPRSGTGA